MSNLSFLLLISLLVFMRCTYSLGRRTCRSEVSLKDEKAIRKFLCYEYEKNATEMCTKAVTAEWNHLVDIKDPQKALISINATIESAKLDKDYWKHFFKDIDVNSLECSSLQRQIKLLSILGVAALGDKKLKELTGVIDAMTQIYGTARVCPFQKPHCDLKTEGLQLDPDLERIMATSRDYDELLYIWLSWREATGAKIKRLYEFYVVLSNDAATANNFTDMGQMWRNEYEYPAMESDLDRLWKEVSPLYEELHRYVLNRLRHVYGKDMPQDDDDLIPAHVLGNMWGQTWTNVRSLVRPYPRADDIDVTEALKKHKYTPHKMFEVANEFYTSLGLASMTMSYDTNTGAVVERPHNREILCHASAWDFCNGKDFRIKMCAEVNHQNFITIHHEMGHIQYYIQYSHLPITFRSGANPGFHEAIGDTIALSASTPHHLKAIGLIQNVTETKESTINALMDMALERIAFLPFGLIVDKWRWDVFANRVDPDQWNAHYWNYREKYQKLKSPMPRTQEDFDIGSKYHIPGDSQYMSYFFAHILEFQLHKALCKFSNNYDKHLMPLHKCDIYKSKAAGDRLKQGLKLGSSKNWKYVLQTITGEKELSGEPLLEYFQPLYDWLVQENDRVDLLYE